MLSAVCFNIHAIIFSDKSRTMDFIFRDLRPFSGTDPPTPDFFFCHRTVVIFPLLLNGQHEILVKINKHIYPCIYDFPYILPQIKPTLKGPKQWPFPNISEITILAVDVFIKMV